MRQRPCAQAARLLEANAPAAQSAAQAPKQQPAAPQRPDFSDDAYYAVVPCASRPSITYDPRAKIPRKNRQAALNRCVCRFTAGTDRAAPQRPVFQIHCVGRFNVCASNLGKQCDWRQKRTNIIVCAGSWRSTCGLRLRARCVRRSSRTWASRKSGSRPSRTPSHRRQHCTSAPAASRCSCAAAGMHAVKPADEP